ncbi:MAG TPA: hypothetical protein DCS87_11740 [Rheinheimera sp.]|nr:hypothetical protein [Rheinheimera sp.]
MKTEAIPKKTIVAALAVADMYSRIEHVGMHDPKTLAHAQTIGTYLLGDDKQVTEENLKAAIGHIALIYGGSEKN